jgi:hypothetical protein
VVADEGLESGMVLVMDSQSTVKEE